MIKKEVRLFLLAIGLVIIFQNPLEDVFNSLIVKPILGQVQSNIFIDLTMLGFLIWMWHDIRGKFTKPTDLGRGYSAVLVFVLGIYIYYRFFSIRYQFTGLHLISEIAYLDIVMLYCFLLVILRPINQMKGKKGPEVSQSSGLVDEPIDDEEEDVLERMPKVRLLVDEIVAATNKNSIAFGVTGEWGSGKTSFLNLVEREISNRDQKDLLVINFNPWLNLGTNTIIQEFFELLRLKIRPHSFDIYMDMGKYSRNILKSSPSSFFKFIGHLLEFGKDNSVTEDFKRINISLKNLGKKFLIVLDDMDRLKADEVFEILKLIRNTANFDNFIYLVAYDKTYISESLSKIGIPKNDAFAEKIFLKEEHLLPITEAKIKKYLADRLKEELPSKKQEIDNYFGYLVRYLTRDRGNFCLKHIRDVKRFLKNFLREYKEMEQEVDFKDYLNVKLLKFKFYDVYRILFLDSYYYLHPSQNTRSASGVARDALLLAYEGENNTGLAIRHRKFEESRLGIYATQVLNMGNDSLKDLKKLVSDLFTNNTYASKSHLSIVFPSHYYRYFQDMLQEHEISEEVFKSEIGRDLDSIQDAISRWNGEGKLDAVRARFYEVSIYNLPDRASFEKFIRAIFALASIPMEKEEHTIGFYGYDLDNLRNVIGDYEERTSKKFYNGKRESLKAFTIELLNFEDYSLEFCACLLNRWYSYYHGYQWILSKPEIKALLIGAFKNYTQTVRFPDDDVWNYYGYCLVTEWDPSGPNSRTSRRVRFTEANDIFIAFIKDHLDQFLIRFIQTPHGLTEANKLGIESIVNDIFGNRSNFMSFLDDMKMKKDEGQLTSEFIDEFQEFAMQLEASGKDGIEFEFEFPPAMEVVASQVWRRA